MTLRPVAVSCYDWDRMRIPEKFWKRFAVGIGILVAVIAVPWVGLRILAEAFRDTQIILTNDTEIPLQIAAISQSHDNNELYIKIPVASEPGKTVTIDGSVDSVRCIFVSGIGGVYFDVGLIDQTPLFSIVTVSDSKNLFGGEVKNYSVDLSALLATFETNECPYMDYIGEVPPAKIPRE